MKPRARPRPQPAPADPGLIELVRALARDAARRDHAAQVGKTETDK